MRKLIPLLLAAGLLAAPQAPPKRASGKPKLVLTIVIDQFRYDYLTRFRSEYNAGFARLLKDGAVFTDAHYEHFPTVTAVGHSTVLTGAPPAISGIVGNEWFDRDSGREVSSVSDDSVQPLGAPGKGAASPRRLLVSTLPDQLKMAGRECKVIGLSLKDRSAILPVGHTADAAYWFDNKTGNIASSTYYMAELPAWVKDLNQSRFADKYLGAEWAPLSKQPSPWPPTLFGKLPAEPGSRYYNAVYTSPFGNDVLLDMATRAIDAEKLGQGAGTDVLSVSFSSNDAVGHRAGPDSPEVRDISIRTDRVIGKLLRHVDEKIGLANTIVVLTADHGVAPVPEILQKEKMPAGRLPAGALRAAAEKALAAKYGEGRWVAAGSAELYLNQAAFREKGIAPAEAQHVVAAAWSALPHVARVYTREDLRAGRLSDDYIGRRVRNGFNYERFADVVAILEPFWLGEGTSGTSHGTPYNYDSHVPVIFLGQGIRAGRYNQRIMVNDIAPTLASLLDVEAPAGAIGRVLDEMLAAPRAAVAGAR